MYKAEVIVIGAGVIGASVAYHLVRGGCGDVLVVDRAAASGEGSTRYATGGFRAQFSSEINVQLSLLSRRKLEVFEQETGIDPGYRPYGYLFLARSDRALAELKEALAIQNACGLTEARIIGAAEALELNPVISDRELVGGAFCPTDGFIKPLNLLHGYQAAATRLGVRFLFGADVDPAMRNLQASTIVNAAGAWAGAFGIPVTPLRRNVAATVPTSLVPESMPMTIWLDDGFHLRQRDGCVLLLWPDQPVVDDDLWFREIARFARERVASVASIPIDRQSSWTGLYEMSPDRHALIGRIEGNVVLANGSSGHGVMHAPAIGQLVSEIVLDGEARSLNIDALRPSRFREGKPIVSTSLL